MSQSKRLAAIAFFLLMMMVLLGPFLSDKSQTFSGEGSAVRQIGYILLLCAAAIAARGLIYPGRLLILPFSMVALLIWCCLSVSWAIEPEIAFRRLVLSIILIWTVFLLVEELGCASVVDVLQLSTTIFLVANYIAVIVVPEIGVHQASELVDQGLVGDWRGVFLQKNFAGAVCAYAIIMFIFEESRHYSKWRVLLIIANAIFLYKTSSKTSMGLLVIGIFVGFIYTHYNNRYRLLALFAIVTVGLPAMLWGEAYWDELTEPFSRQDALTGRVQIWPPLLAYARDHWLTGAGFGSFWNIGGQHPIYRYAKGWVTLVGNGHNGYLDVLVQIGFPGLLLAVVAVFVLPFLKLVSSLRVGPRRGAMLMAMLLFAAGHNITETSLLERDAIVQTFLMLTVAMIYKADRASDRGSQRASITR